MSRYEYDPGGTAYSDGRREGANAERRRIVGQIETYVDEIRRRCWEGETCSMLDCQAKRQCQRHAETITLSCFDLIEMIGRDG